MTKTTALRKALGRSLLFLTFILFTAFTFIQKREKPTLYIIGDSTVKNGSGKGDGGMWGWGGIIDAYFNTEINIENHALGGTSSRTFQTRGLWKQVLDSLKPGDFVIMQFGHNDGGPLDDTARARGTIKGTGSESREIYNPILKKQEVVHTYGWYIGRFIQEAKAKGAVPIVCSLVPRNIWGNGKVKRNTEDYAKWAEEAAKKYGAFFIDLNKITADKYDAMGQGQVKALFPVDHTHTGRKGAVVNALSVIEGLLQLKNCPLNKYLAVTPQ